MGAETGNVEVHLLTAVHALLADHLDATDRSVSSLRAAVRHLGIHLYWHVVVDGQHPPPMRPSAATSFTTPCADMGVSAARNLALDAVEAEGWIFRLDGDDTVNVPGWQRLLTDPLFGSTPWHATNLTDHTGRITPHWFSHPRLWAQDEVAAAWTSPMSFHPNNIVVRTKLAREVGGWPPLPVGEDLLWCFLLNERAPGLALPHVTLRYRKWSKQTVARREYLREKRSAFEEIERAVNQSRTSRGLPPVCSPSPTPGAHYLQ